MNDIWSYRRQVPSEDYERLMSAYDLADVNAIEEHKEKLESKIKVFAKDIKDNILILLRLLILLFYFYHSRGFMLRCCVSLAYLNKYNEIIKSL